jgi:hypothetical protein
MPLDGVQASTGAASVGGSPAGLALVPGLGVVVVAQSPPSLVLLSSVVIVAQPGNASVLAGSNATFTVATTQRQWRGYWSFVCASVDAQRERGGWELVVICAHHWVQ